MAEFVTLFTCTDVVMAQIARTKLEAEGIPCFLANEHLASVHWLYSNAIGGVEVKVLESDADRAIRLFTEDSFSGIDQPVEETSDSLHQKPDEAGPPIPSASIPEAPLSSPPLPDAFLPDTVCPVCGSDAVESKNFRRSLTIFFNLLTSFPLPFFIKPRHNCKKCGYEWKE